MSLQNCANAIKHITKPTTLVERANGLPLSRAAPIDRHGILAAERRQIQRRAGRRRGRVERVPHPYHLTIGGPILARERGSVRRKIGLLRTAPDD